MHKAITALSLTLSALLAGCNGVGHGNKPESFVIRQDLTKDTETSGKAFTCIPAQLIIVGKFSNGDLGNFASRAKWSTDQPDVLYVSNTDDPGITDPTKHFGTGGTLIILKPPVEGRPDPIVHMEYLGFTGDFPVHLAKADRVEFLPAKAMVPTEAFGTFALKATVEGITSDISNTAIAFSIDNQDDTIGLLSTDSGLVALQGVSPGGPLTVRATLEVPCTPEMTNDNVATTTAVATVANLDASKLTLDYEPGFYDTAAGDTVGDLAEQTSEFLKFVGHFGDVDGNGVEDTYEQFDLSTQVLSQFVPDIDGDGVCEFDQETTVSGQYIPILFGGILSGAGNAAVAIADDPDDGLDAPTKICAGFGTSTVDDGDGSSGTFLPKIVAPTPLPILVKDTDVTSFEVSTTDICTTATDPDCDVTDPPRGGETPIADGHPFQVTTGQLFRLKVHGTFAKDYKQDITRDVAIASSNVNVLAVSAGRAASAGSVLSRSLTTFENVDGCDQTAAVSATPHCDTTITVTWTHGDDDATNDIVQTFPISITLAPTTDDKHGTSAAGTAGANQKTKAGT